MPVGFFYRAAAILIDWALLTGTTFILGFLADTVDGGSTSQFYAVHPSRTSSAHDLQNLLANLSPGMRMIFALLMFVPLLFPFIFEVLLNGTPGKYILGIRIASVNGSWASFGQKCMRFSIKYIAPLVFTCAGVLAVVRGRFEGIPILVTLGSLAGLVITIGMLRALGQSRQALHDVYADTAVYFARDVEKASTTSQPSMLYPHRMAGPRGSRDSRFR